MITVFGKRSKNWFFCEWKDFRLSLQLRLIPSGYLHVSFGNFFSMILYGNIFIHLSCNICDITIEISCFSYMFFEIWNKNIVLMGGTFIVLAWVFKYVHCSSLDTICNNHICARQSHTCAILWNCEGKIKRSNAYEEMLCLYWCIFSHRRISKTKY